MPHWFDKPLRGQSTDDPWTDSGGVTGICMKMLPPSSCGMSLVTAAWCGFLRDGIEERGERGGDQAKDVQPETQRQGRGLFHPPPRRAASPRGRFPIDTVPCRRQALIGLTENSIKSRFLPVHGIRPIAMHCPPPRKGAGGGRGSGRAAGVIDCSHGKPFPVTRRDRGGGCSTPPPRQPLPPRGDSP